LLSSMPETVRLSDPRTPLQIEYSAGAMEQIRERARGGLMAAPRVAFGEGGLLLGVCNKQVIKLLDSVEIPCSHSTGPSFQLNADEMRETREMIAEVGRLSGPGGVSVVGWYCSKTRGDVRLSEIDLGLFDELFPASGQIALVIRPAAVGPMRGAFFFRDSSGAIADGPECVVSEWRAASTATSEPDPETPETPTPAPRVEPPPSVPVAPVIEPPSARPSATPQETTLADIIQATSTDQKPAPARPVTNPGLFGVPGLEPPRPRTGWRHRMMAIGAAAAVLAVVGAGYVTRNDWLPKPPLALTSTEENGSLLIRWNSAALRGVEHASLLVNDGGQPTPTVVSLDGLQVVSGLYIYMPKSLRVTAKLNAGDITGITAWFAEPPPKPAATPAANAVPDTAPVPVAPLTEAKPTSVTQTHPAQDETKPKP
jgi:hypothetical protein